MPVDFWKKVLGYGLQNQGSGIILQYITYRKNEVGQQLLYSSVLQAGNTSQFSLTKLIVSHDFPCSTGTNQMSFDQQDSNTIPEFERTMDRRCQALVSKLETSVPSL